MSHKRSFDQLRKAGLAYPEAYEETPWGEHALKVRGKMFLLVSRGREKRGLFATLKLPETHVLAASLEFAEPSGYGLGKSGWVTARFEAGEDVPLELLEEWLDESYRAVAPKRLVKALGGDGAAPFEAPKKVARKKKTSARSKQPAVLLVGDDPLRLKRAEKGLAEKGFKKVSTSTQEGLARLKRRAFALVVFDLGRRAVAGLEVAQDRLESKKDGALLLVGIRDARFEQRVKKAFGREVGMHRKPPGDPRVLEALARRLEKA